MVVDAKHPHYRLATNEKKKHATTVGNLVDHLHARDAAVEAVEARLCDLIKVSQRRLGWLLILMRQLRRLIEAECYTVHM